MSNNPTQSIFEIRVCENCGLRYPLQVAPTAGGRCPACLGKTHPILQKPIPDKEQDFFRSKKRNAGGLTVLLDNIRSAWNVGSIFRSADGFGFDHAFLCGITPTPDNEAVVKTSLGAEENIPWTYHKDAVKLVMGLKNDGWRVLALEDEQSSREIGKTSLRASEKSVLILGNEVTGVDPGLIALSDEILYIPMHGKKRSLNVAIAFSVAAYALDRQTWERFD